MRVGRSFVAAVVMASALLAMPTVHAAPPVGPGGDPTAAASARADHGAVSQRFGWSVVDDVDSSGVGVPFGGWVGSRSLHLHVPRPRPGWRRPAAADLRAP